MVCPLIHKHIMLKGTGVAKPCCRFILTDADERIRLQDHKNLDDLFLNSGQLSHMRELDEEGSVLSNCAKCAGEEEAGIKSMRQFAIDQFGEDTDVELQFLEISTSNTCNYRCRICNSDSSSGWFKESHLFDNYPGMYTGDKERMERIDVKKLPKKTLNNLKYLKITGGEPFYDKAFYQILDKVKNNKNLTIEIHTNGSIIPEEKYVKILEGFKETQIRLSIDGIGKRAEYMRNPCKWNDIESNTDFWQSKNIALQVNPTISVYNVLYWDELSDWIAARDLKRSLQFVHQPEHLCIYNLDDRLKNEINKQLTNTKIEKFLSINKQRDIELTFLKFTEVLDRSRNESFKETFPELHSLLDKYFG